MTVVRSAFLAGTFLAARRTRRIALQGNKTNALRYILHGPERCTHGTHAFESMMLIVGIVPETSRLSLCGVWGLSFNNVDGSNPSVPIFLAATADVQGLDKMTSIYSLLRKDLKLKYLLLAVRRVAISTRACS